MTLPKYYIFGTGPQAHYVLENCHGSSRFFEHVFRIFKDDKTKNVGGLSVIDPPDDLPEDAKYILCVSNRYNTLKHKMFNRYTLDNHMFSAISAHARISRSAYISDGAIINAGAVISHNVYIGLCAMIHSNSVIEHDCKIGDFVDIAPSATLCGKVNVGNNCSIFANATILPNVKIGNNSIIGAGVTIKSDVPDDTVVYGCRDMHYRHKHNGRDDYDSFFGEGEK